MPQPTLLLTGHYGAKQYTCLEISGNIFLDCFSRGPCSAEWYAQTDYSKVNYGAPWAVHWHACQIAQCTCYHMKMAKSTQCPSGREQKVTNVLHCTRCQLSAPTTSFPPFCIFAYLHFAYFLQKYAKFSAPNMQNIRGRKNDPSPVTTGYIFHAVLSPLLLVDVSSSAV